MWKIFSEHGSSVPQEIGDGVLNVYNGIVVNSNNNPIEKVALAVDGKDAELVMDILFDEEDDEHSERNHGTRSARNRNQQEVWFLRSQIMHMREENRELRIELERRDKKMERQLNFLNRNVQRIAYAPGTRRTPTQGSTSTAPNFEVLESQNVEYTGAEEQNRLTAVLGKHPQTLHDLWNEYEFGSAGHKPAKDFTAKERGGKNKHMFYLRKFLWNKVAEMVRSGMDARTACDKIYDVYGHNQSVSNQI